MNQPWQARLSRLPSPEQVVVQAALQRRYLTPDALSQALDRLEQSGPGGSLLPILGQGFIPPERIEELRHIYQQASAASGGGTRVDGATMVTAPAHNLRQSTHPDLGSSSVTGTIPSRLGPYEMERELASGGMGVVWIARHTQLERRVALKLLRSASDSQLVERFQLEARAAARLKHANIVGILDVGQEQGFPYLAMDLVEGTDLKGRITKEGPLPCREAARIIEKISRAVYYAHTRSILHRDIKPHNVLLGADGEPLLTDFGLAKDVSQEAQGVTVSGQVMGTPSYMPPEQAEGRLDAVDRRSDVYSLGATLYEALSGKPPFEGATSLNVIVGVLHKDPVPPSRTRQGVDPDLETICLKCLEKEPERRYDSALALADDLARYQADEPILARPVGIFGRTFRRARRNRTVVSGFGLAAVLVLAVWAAMTVQVVRAEREARVARRDEQAQREEAEAAAESARREERKARRAEMVQTARAGLERGYALLAVRRDREAAIAFAEAWKILSTCKHGEGEAADDAHPERAGLLRQAAELGVREALGRFGPPTRRWSEADNYCAVAPNGQILVVVHGAHLVMWDLVANEELASVRLPGGDYTNALAFSPDGERVAVATDDGLGGAVALVLEVPSGRELLRFPGLPGAIAASCVAFGPRGNTLALGTVPEGSVLVWDLRTGERVWHLRSEDRPTNEPYVSCARTCRFSHDGQVLAVGYEDGMAWLWDMASGRAAQGFHNHPGTAVWFSALTPSETLRQGSASLITGGGDGRLQILRQGSPGQAAPEPLHLLKGLYGNVFSGDLSPDGRLLAAGCRDGSVFVWDLSFPEPVLLQKLRGHRSRVLSCAFSEDGRTLVSSGRSAIRVWDTRRVRCFEGWGPIAFGPGRVLAWGLRHPKVREYHTGVRVADLDRPDEALYQVQIHHLTGRLQEVALSPNGETLVLALDPPQFDIKPEYCQLQGSTLR